MSTFDEELDNLFMDDELDVLSPQVEAWLKGQIKALIKKHQPEDYSCEICGADPMGVDCNNANCDR